MSIFKKSAIIAMSLILLALPAGCSDTEPAEDLAARYFGYIKAGQFDAALGLFSSVFLERTPAAIWSEDLERLCDEMVGELIAFRLKEKTVSGFFGLGGGQKSAVLEYKVYYDFYDVTETLTIVEVRKGIWRIQVHDITPTRPIISSLDAPIEY